MDIIEKIKNSDANIQQIALLSGIPADRIYKWQQGKGSPDGEDILKVEATLLELSNLSKDEIKKKVHEANKRFEQALKIATGNPSLKVEDLLAADIRNNNDKKNSKKAAKGEQKQQSGNQNNSSTLARTKKEEDNMLMEVQLRTSKAQEDTAAALKDIAKASLIIAELIRERFAGTGESLGKVREG